MNVLAKNLLVFFCLVFLFIPKNAAAQDEKFQAIFLYKFIENVNWPDDRRNLVVGIIGQSSVQDELEKIIQTRNGTIKVKQIVSEEAAECDVVFLPKKGNSWLHAIVENTNRKSVLIVTETAGLTKQGACISFVRDKNKLGFAVNKSTLDIRSLKVSSSLLNLSQEI